MLHTILILAFLPAAIVAVFLGFALVWKIAPYAILFISASLAYAYGNEPSLPRFTLLCIAIAVFSAIWIWSRWSD